MSSIGAARAHVERLVAANIRASVDSRNLNPPCVLFTPPARIGLDLGCAGSAEMRALIVVPGPGTGQAWAQLDTILGEIVASDLLPVESVTATEFDSADQTLLPAYELSWVEAVTIEGDTQ